MSKRHRHSESRRGRSRPTRRGIALLLAMAALLTMTVVVTSVVRSAATSRITHRRQAAENEATAIVDALVGLLPDVMPVVPGEPRYSPWITVIDSQKEGVALIVRGIDLSGRLHIKHFDKAARLGLPTELRSLGWDDDEYIGPIMLEQLMDPDEMVQVYPEPLPKPDLKWDPDAEETEDEADDQTDDEPRDRPYDDPSVELVDTRIIVSEWVTTVGSGALNVNTAPYRLLVEALADAKGNIGHDECLAARLEGLPVPPEVVMQLNASGNPDGDDAEEDDTDENDRSIRFTNESEAFGLIVEVHYPHGPLRWWMTIEREEDGWRLVERRRIYP